LPINLSSGRDGADRESCENVPREPEVETHELDRALRGLTRLGNDPFLGIQAPSAALVDCFVTQMESKARAYRSGR
jgi:alpha-beta hydrolase superfamily lysophospholipase